MFSNVNDMNELRMLRAEKIKEGVRPEEVNAAFNQRKRELEDMKKEFFQIPVLWLEMKPLRKFSCLPYLGRPKELFSFELSDKGVRF